MPFKEDGYHFDPCADAGVVEKEYEGYTDESEWTDLNDYEAEIDPDNAYDIVREMEWDLT
jgi:hypothetical protein